MQPSTSATVPATGPSFTERLWPAATGWVAVLGLATMLAISLWPIGATWGVLGGVVGLVVGVVVSVGAASRIAVTDGELVAGTAHVPVALLREPRALDAATTRQELGPGLDARAHLCLRGWVRTAVRVELNDPADPTPYWLVSTRRPEALVEALSTTRSTAPDVARG